MSRLKKIAFMRNLFVAITVFVLLGMVISSQAIATRFEETHPDVSCQANWQSFSDSNASGGSITYSDTATDSCTFTFNGTSIRYIATPSNNKGIASVQVDSAPPVDVDLYSSTLQYQQVLYTKENLSPDWHTITITVTGRKNDSSSLHQIDVDAFDVETEYWKDYNGADPGGYMPDIDQNQDFDKKLARTQEVGAGVSYVGNWPTKNPLGASGEQLAVSNDLAGNASCSFTFHGTSISWIGAKAPQGGKSEVRIDDILMETVDLYNASILLQQVLYSKNGLSHGNHTIKITPTNQKNPLSTGNFTAVDAFDVDDIEHEYCAPVAEANSLWWLDKKYRLGIFGNPYTAKGYVGGDINLDGRSDILDLVQDLAVQMKTNVGHTGTTVEEEQLGIGLWATKYPRIGLLNRLEEHTMDGNNPQLEWLEMFHYLELEVERSQDVKLDLGFWHVDSAIQVGQNLWEVIWSRRGGHAVTVAGVDSMKLLFAISDPDNDRAEAQLGPGVVRPGLHGYPHDPALHNNEMYASHDIYTVGPSPSPGGKMGLLNYPSQWNFPEQEWEVVGPVTVEWPEPLSESMTFTEVEAAVIVSPKQPWPHVRCQVTPVQSEPLKIIRGGTLRCNASVHNDTDEVQEFQFATAITLPDNNRYEDAPKKVVGPKDLSLDPGESMSKYLTLVIPMNAPYGTYTYRGYIGKNGSLYPECEFTFSVVQ